MNNKKLSDNRNLSLESTSDRYMRLLKEADKLDELAYRTLSSEAASGGDWREFALLKKSAVSKREKAKLEQQRSAKLGRSASRYMSGDKSEFE